MRRTLSTLCAMAALAAALSPANAEPLPAVITVAAYTFLPGDNQVPQLPLVVQRGGRLIFASGDNLGFHAIVSVDAHPDATPLFWAEQIGPGQMTEVHGVPDLAPGSYWFYCTNHPDMDGTLTVASDDSGAVPPSSVS